MHRASSPPDPPLQRTNGTPRSAACQLRDWGPQIFADCLRTAVAAQRSDLRKRTDSDVEAEHHHISLAEHPCRQAQRQPKSSRTICCDAGEPSLRMPLSFSCETRVPFAALAAAIASTEASRRVAAPNDPSGSPLRDVCG